MRECFPYWMPSNFKRFADLGWRDFGELKEAARRCSGHPSALEQVHTVGHGARTSTCNDWNGYLINNGREDFKIEAVHHSVAINRIDHDLASSGLLGQPSSLDHRTFHQS